MPCRACVDLFEPALDQWFIASAWLELAGQDHTPLPMSTMSHHDPSQDPLSTVPAIRETELTMSSIWRTLHQ